ncbi:hypothetical protein [Phormidium sp. CCY1219]|uniref:hypothetical protein n=1 Tax=Phormidium sp. CCY1219 TaxID=2886104 RepID=UPI002D1F7D84|nr:hypothetical protein [Phormidium sp. CCY1219]MEB3827608.1 hypothetical protein [Phormidium sp. CCY1219]
MEVIAHPSGLGELPQGTTPASITAIFCQSNASSKCTNGEDVGMAASPGSDCLFDSIAFHDFQR